MVNADLSIWRLHCLPAFVNPLQLTLDGRSEEGDVAGEEVDRPRGYEIGT